MTTNEIFGRPVEGTVRPTSERQKDQAEPQEFIAALDALLEIPEVIEYKWNQYTPYWNDGEECTFRVSTDWNAGVKLTFGDEDGGETEEGYYNEYDLRSESTINGHDVKEIHAALVQVELALERGHHDVFLKDSFGDHAEVYATKEGFRIEFYDHD